MTKEHWLAFETWKAAYKAKQIAAINLADWILEYGSARDADIQKYRQLAEFATEKWMDVINESRKETVT